jgi:hypothetical protein
VWRPGGWALIAVDHNPASDEARARAREVSIIG